MINIQELLKRTVEKFVELNIDYEVERFPSGCVMLDIWHDKKFYVIQFEMELVGLSEINDDIGFDTIPDEKFEDDAEYMRRLEYFLIRIKPITPKKGIE